MVIQCCVCKKVRKNGGWVVDKGVEPASAISHGYCPTCAEAAFNELRAHHAVTHQCLRAAMTS